jgi:hypothetical protein
MASSHTQRKEKAWVILYRDRIYDLTTRKAAWEPGQNFRYIPCTISYQLPSKLRKDHVKSRDNIDHPKDEIYCCIECYDDEINNAALDEVIKKIKEVN